MSNEKMGQLIKFPGGSRETQTTPAETPSVTPPPAPKANKSPKTPKAKKAAVISALAIVLGISFYSNRHSENGEVNLSSQSGRGIASVEVQPVRDPAAEKELVRQLSQGDKRSIASLGANPSVEDRLRFEILDARYRFEFSQGKISSIEFTPQWDDGSSPKYVVDRVEFLKSARSVLPNFTNTEIHSKEVFKDSIAESYRLIENGVNVGEVEFNLDLAGRLRSMKVLNVSSNQ